MPGRPIQRAQERTLEAVGEEALLEIVMDGASVRDILRTFDVGMRGWYGWLDRVEGRRERFEDARKIYAESLDQEGMEIADEVEPDKEHIAKAKLQVEQRRHVAATADKSRQKGGQGTVTFNVQNLHLKALRDNMERRRLGAGNDEEDVVEGEYEVEEDES